MRIAFILNENNIAEPMGIMYLSGLLKLNSHQAKLFHASKKNWLDDLKDFNPDIAAYSVISGSHNDYLKINNQVKKNFDLFSIFGGPHTTFFPETIKKENVDAICIGEGEQAILELITNKEKSADIFKTKNIWFKNGESIIKNEVRPLMQNLDVVPFPDRDIIYSEDKYLMESKIKRFLSNRGCPFKCTYCFNHAYNEIYKENKKIIRWRSVKNLINEIQEVKEKYPLGLVRFIDDIFILPPVTWLEEFADMYRSYINLPFVCNLHVKTVTENKVKLLKQAGCSAVYMAIEAGNDRMRNQLLDRNMTKEEMLRSFNLVHKYKLSIASENILGLPGGTLENDLETLKLNISCKVDNPISTIFQPYPKTRLGEYAVENGFFDGDFDSLGKSYFGLSPLKFSSNLEKRKIENLQRFFGLGVNFPILLFVIKVLILFPPNKIYDLIYRFWDSYSKINKIFKVKFTFKDYLAAIVRVLKY